MSSSDELKAEICKILSEFDVVDHDADVFVYFEFADRILAIPEIAQALLAQARETFLDAMGESVDLSSISTHSEDAAG